MSIRIGTSGYSFKDWRGAFYPEKISPGALLKYYSAYFDITEINATYYGIPSPSTFKRMAETTPPGFGFFVKLHSSMTHDRKPAQADFDRFKSAMLPLADSGKLLGLLA